MLSARTDVSVLEAYDGAAWQTAAFYPSFLYAANSSNQDVTTSTTFVDATGITVQVVANATYELMCRFWILAPTAGDYKGQFIQPAGCTHTYTPMGFNTGATGSVPDQSIYMLSITDASWAGGGVAGTVLTFVQGLVTVGGTAGTFKFQFAQNASSGTTTLLAKSHMILRRVA